MIYDNDFMCFVMTFLLKITDMLNFFHFFPQCHFTVSAPVSLASACEWSHQVHAGTNCGWVYGQTALANHNQHCQENANCEYDYIAKVKGVGWHIRDNSEFSNVS